MNTVQFEKATIGFSKNLFQVITCGRLIYIEAYTQQSFLFVQQQARSCEGIIDMTASESYMVIHQGNYMVLIQSRFLKVCLSQISKK